MTTRTSALSLLSALLLATGCAAPGEDIGETGDELLMRAVPIATPAPVVVARPRPRPPTIAVPRSCNRDLMLGIPRYANRCPAASGSWTGGAALGGVRTPTGDPICAYEYIGSRTSWSISGLPADRGSDDVRWQPAHEWLEPDCDAVVALADPTVEEALAAVTGAHERAWRAHIGRVDALPSITSFSGAPALPRTVRVAVLDDVRGTVWGETDFPVTGTGHGQSVALAIRDVLCPAGRDGVCPVDFKSYPVIFEGASGGGSILALAEAIVRATRDGAEVINLSVGFDEAFAWRGSPETKAYFDRGETIRAALEYAACRDVVVVAAAGNDGAGPNQVTNRPNAMYPAAFASERRHSCDGRGTRISAPLLHLASGVGPADEDIANSRPMGIAELAAPAFALTFADPRPGAPEEHLPLRTGSSFGAAGVSAVAALIRAYLPDLSAQETMDLVLESAVDLGRDADVCHNPRSSCHVNRVSACGALRGALDELCADSRYYWSCGWARWALRCDTPAAGSPPGPAAPDFDAAALATMVEAQFSTVAAPGCSLSTVQASGAQGHYCPADAFDNGINDPGTLTEQPGDDPCRVCGVTLASDDPDDWMVVIGLDPDLTGSLSSPVLRVGDQAYALGDATIASASSGAVVGVRLSSFTYTPASASLSFRNGSGKSLSSQLPVW